MSLVLYLKRHRQNHLGFLLLSSRNCVVLYRTSKSMIHSELTLVKGVMSVSRFIFLCECPVVPAPLAEVCGVWFFFFNFYCYPINWDYNTGLRTQHGQLQNIQMLCCYVVVTGPHSLNETHHFNSSVHLQFCAPGDLPAAWSADYGWLDHLPVSPWKMTRMDCSTCLILSEQHNPIWTPASSSAETVTWIQNIQTK